MSDISQPDQLNIETPEQVDLHLPIAGIGSRFLAILTDTVIQIVAETLLILLIVLFISASQQARIGHLRTLRSRQCFETTCLISAAG